MATIFDSLKGLITPELISQASSALSEDNGNVTKAVTAAIPSILGSILAKGNDTGVESALKEAGSAHDSILSNIGSLFSGNTNQATQGIGGNLLNAILGDKLGGLASLISSVSGISNNSSHGLLSMVTPLIGGFLGNKMSTEGLNLSGLLGKLASEKGSFLSAIPSGLTGLLGLSSLANLGDSFSGGINKVASEAKQTIETVEKKKNGWLKWLIPLLLILLALIIWRTCSHKKPVIETDKIEAAADSAKSTINNAENTVENAINSLTELSLTDGVKLQAFKGGIEDQMINFLMSNDYKSATPEALKEKWFNFDDIHFEFGKAKLTDSSYRQIDNIVAILKHYKDAKIKIGGYTDKKGDVAANLKLSQERANEIKKVLTEKGVGKQVVEAEGYGDKFATVAADASDEARAVDRKMALRFAK